MGFEKELSEALYGKSMGSGALVMHSKERQHISRSTMEAFGNAAYLSANTFANTMYEGETMQAARYIAARDLTFDMLVSVYDVNSRALACARFFPNPDRDKEKLKKFVYSLRDPNLEARLIGLQTGQNTAGLEGTIDFLGSVGIPIVEADLFGADTRHVAIDSKLGTSFNILVDDRLYRPGELVNKLTQEQFERTLMGQQP